MLPVDGTPPTVASTSRCGSMLVCSRCRDRRCGPLPNHSLVNFTAGGPEPSSVSVAPQLYSYGRRRRTILCWSRDVSGRILCPGVDMAFSCITLNYRQVRFQDTTFRRSLSSLGPWCSATGTTRPQPSAGASRLPVSAALFTICCPRRSRRSAI